MINLLPKTARTKASREYWRRLAAVCMMIAAALLLAGTALLAPAYMAVRAEQRAADRMEALAEQTNADPSLKAAAADIAKTAALYSAAQDKSSLVRPSAVISLLTAARPPGVAIRQIVYSRSGSAVSVALTGVAAEREGVLGYKSNLLGVPGVASADFPAADLAASSTVLFTMKVKYAPPAPTASRSP